MAVWCTNTSAPPSGWEMKPKPFSALNHLTVPEATVAFPFPSPTSCSRQPRFRIPGPDAPIGRSTTEEGGDGLPARETLAAHRRESNFPRRPRLLVHTAFIAAGPGYPRARPRPASRRSSSSARSASAVDQSRAARASSRRRTLSATSGSGASVEGPPRSAEARARRHRSPPCAPNVGRRGVAGVGGGVGPPGEVEHRRPRHRACRGRRPWWRRKRRAPRARVGPAGQSTGAATGPSASGSARANRRASSSSRASPASASAIVSGVTSMGER